MAPTGSVAGGVVSPKAGASGRAKENSERDEIHSESLPRMTPELLLSICKERQMWTQPHLNTQLFLNYKGFLRIEAMEDYCNVRALHLDNNNISAIEGLDRMTELRSLHLGGNRISEISGLESNLDLRVLNLEGNAISSLQNLGHLVKLENLNLASNRVVNLEDITALQDLPAMTNVDISHNLIETVEGVVEFWSELKILKVLRNHGNPGIRNVAHYRKRLVNALPSLSYLDERPVFPVERKSFKAWEEGGLEAMHKAKQEFHKMRHAECGVDPERREFLTNRRKMAIERIDRQAKEKEEKEEKENLERREAAEEQAGPSKAALAGDPEALQQYEKGWMTKVSLYGVDGLSAVVAQEGKGGLTPDSWFASHAAQATAQPSQPKEKSPAQAGSIPLFGHTEDGGETNASNPLFGFAPPPRESAASEPVQQPAAVATEPLRRREKAQATVADFRQASSGRECDGVDRQFAVFGEDLIVPTASLPSATNSRGASGRNPQGASAEPVMPLIWEARQKEVAAAEREALERNFAPAKPSAAAISCVQAAAFRSNELEGLD